MTDQEKPSNRKRRWTSDDDAVLLALVKRHKPLAEIASVLDRTVAGIRSRLWDEHAAEWASSGHPSYQPHKGRRAEPTDETPHACGSRLDDLERQLSQVRRDLATLQRELGVGEGGS